MSPGLRRRILVIGSLLSVLGAFFVGVGGYSEQFGGSRIFLAVAVQLGGVVFWMALTRSLYGRRMKNAQVPDRSRFQFAGSAGLRSRGSQASCVRIHPMNLTTSMSNTLETDTVRDRSVFVFGFENK